MNEETGAVEKFTQLFTLKAKKREACWTKTDAGDIGALLSN